MDMLSPISPVALKDGKITFVPPVTPNDQPSLSIVTQLTTNVKKKEVENRLALTQSRLKNITENLQAEIDADTELLTHFK